MSNRLRVYVASALGEQTWANSTADAIETRGHTVISRWHRQATEKSDPTNPSLRAEYLTENLADLDHAHAVVALTALGNPRATYTEIGYALARLLPVVWLVGPEGQGMNLFTAHPAVDVVQGLAGALVALEKIALGIRT